MPTAAELHDNAERERNAERAARERADTLAEGEDHESIHEENSRGADRTLAQEEARIHAARAESYEESALAAEEMESAQLDAPRDDGAYEYAAGDDDEGDDEGDAAGDDEGDDDDYSFAELDDDGDDSAGADDGDDSVVRDVAGIPDDSDSDSDSDDDVDDYDPPYDDYDAADATEFPRPERRAPRNVRALREATPEEIAALELELAQAQALEIAPLPVLTNVYAGFYPPRRSRNARARR